MTIERLLIGLVIIAGALLAAALGPIDIAAPATAQGTAVPTAAATVPPLSSGLFGWLMSREAPLLAIGFAFGWALRWVYSLPWSELPRAIVAWLLGWRTSAAMLVMAVGCTAILLFY